MNSKLNLELILNEKFIKIVSSMSLILLIVSNSFADIENSLSIWGQIAILILGAIIGCIIALQNFNGIISGSD